VTFVFVTLVIYVLARFSPNQWEEPPNCIKDPEEYTNQASLLSMEKRRHSTNMCTDFYAVKLLHQIWIVADLLQK
jgi:hypothetical protein